MNTIVFCFPPSASGLARIAARVPDWELVLSDQSSIARDILRADVFCGHAKVPVDWDTVVRNGRLKWIQSSAAGLDHCLVPSVRASDILVSGASGLFADQVAEQTLALVYGLVRGLPAYFRAQQAKTFERLAFDDLRTKHVLVLGCGGNGQRISEQLSALCLRLVATDLFPGQVETGGDYEVVAADETDQWLAWADLVVCSLPLLPETAGFLNHRRLSLIRPGGYLVNVGRGPLVDETALVELLRAGHLRGAGLDVFVHEPPPADCPFWEMENVIMTPHVGAQSMSRYADVTDLFSENLRRWLAGETLINLVDSELGLPRPENRLAPDWRSEAWAGHI